MRMDDFKYTRLLVDFTFFSANCGNEEGNKPLHPQFAVVWVVCTVVVELG